MSDLENNSGLSENAERIKYYLERVNKGEDFDTVQSDFAKEFTAVPVMDIMNAEQALIKEGIEPQKMKKLCDIHSALFHGQTEDEVISEESRLKKFKISDFDYGHPVTYFVHENSSLEKLLNIALFYKKGGKKELLTETFQKLKKVRVFYGKKEELIMPVLEKYGVTGPSEVMWNVDDEIKNEVGRIANTLPDEEIDELSDAIDAVVKRMKEMIYKDENILLPVALKFFTDDEWVKIYRDEFEMGPVFINEIPKWEHGEEEKDKFVYGIYSGKTNAPEETADTVNDGTAASTASLDGLAVPSDSNDESSSEPNGVSKNAGNAAAVNDSAILFTGDGVKTPAVNDSAILFTGDGVKTPAGKLTIEQLKGILSVLPIDITFIDEEPRNQFYKNSDQVFSRPLSSLGEVTYKCHPVFIRPVVKKLLSEFRAGTKDSFERVFTKDGRKIRVLYLAVRNDEGKYLGTAEVVQDLSQISE